MEYSNNLVDKELIKIAKNEGRILLTRDLQLFQQASMHGAESFLVGGANDVEKLAILANRFDLRLEVDVSVSRCPKCNTPITVISKEKVAGKVPEKTFLRYNEFWECPNCKKLYWQGSHWTKINQTLQDAQNRRASLKTNNQ